MANIMLPYSFYAGYFTAALHFMPQEMFGAGKQAIGWLWFITMCHVLCQTIAQQLGNGDDPVALWCFRGRDYVFAMNPLIAFVDRKLF